MAKKSDRFQRIFNSSYKDFFLLEMKKAIGNDIKLTIDWDSFNTIDEKTELYCLEFLDQIMGTSSALAGIGAAMAVKSIRFANQTCDDHILSFSEGHLLISNNWLSYRISRTDFLDFFNKNSQSGSIVPAPGECKGFFLMRPRSN